MKNIIPTNSFFVPSTKSEIDEYNIDNIDRYDFCKKITETQLMHSP